jgi:hypothetical protein
LLVLDRLGDDLGVKVVMQVVGQRRLDRQRLVQELFEEVLAGLLAHEDAAGRGVDHRTASPTHHL